MITGKLDLVSVYIFIYEMFCAIWHHLYNLKNVKNTDGGVLLLNTPPWVFFAFFKLQMLPNRATYHIFED